MNRREQKMTEYKAGDGVTVFGVISTGEVSGGFIAVTFGRNHIAAVPETDIRTHEPMTLEHRLSGLTLEQISDALSRKDSILADAFEAIGAKIAKARRDSGELRRPRAPKETAAIPVAAEAAGEAHEPQPADTPAAEPEGLEVTTYMLAEMAAKQGRKSLDKFIKHIGVDAREEINEFMPELLGVADAHDDDAVLESPVDGIPF